MMQPGDHTSIPPAKGTSEREERKARFGTPNKLLGG